MSTLEFKAAAATVLPFGKFKGQTIDQVAQTDAGLTYLDWARGAWTDCPRISRPIHTYLSDPAIAKDLETAIREQARDRDYAKRQWR
jgi:hypothetical protein